MKKHYMEFIERADLPQEASVYLTESVDKLLPKYENELTEIIDFLYNNDFKVSETEEMRKNLAEKSGLHFHTLTFIFLVCASKRMLADFIAKGYSEELFWETILDLKYKLFECKTVKGVWGNFVEGWYNIFYSLDIFKLGRLEYERIAYPEDEEEYSFGDIAVKHGDTVYSVHIPSAGPLTWDLRLESYKKAFEFFAKERGDKPLICVCHSWLLFKGNANIFPEKMNIAKFLKDWDVINSYEKEDFSDCWRLFGKEYDGKPENLPQETNQQKAMVDWLKAGKKTGEGFGVLIFDGEKIINV